MKSVLHILAAAFLSVSASLNLPASAQTQTQTFGDWAKQCEKAGSSERCYLIQTVKAGERPIMVVIVAYSPKRDKMAAMIDVPLGMHLPTGLQVATEGADAKLLPFEQCLPTGCRAILALDPAMIEALKSGRSASINGRGRDGEDVQMPISSNGFKEAFEAL